MQNEQATSTVIVNGEQAKQEMTALEQKARSLKERLIEANKAGDGKAYDKLSKELKKAQREMKQLNKESFDVKRVLDNLSGSSLKELEAAQKRLNAQLRSGDIKRNTKEWRENVEAQKKVRAEIRSINSEMQAGESRISKFANGFNKYFSSIAAGFAAFAGVTLSLKKYSDNRIELEDSKANLQALTGLNVDDINWLTEEARKLSTELSESGIRIRKSSKDIVDAYTLVGSAKPELLENRDALKEVTEQTLILAEASKMELADAVKGITMAMNQYSADARDVSRYTNVLAAGSKFGAANVESVTSAILRSGVAAAQANIPIEALVGTIETLAEKGITDEIAGTGLKKFFLTLQTGADDTNPKVVGLDKALENLAKKQLSATEIKKMFGEEGYNVAAVLLSETERVKYFTEAVTGTSTALEQASINSETMAAKLAQAKNKLNEAGMEFVSTLNPAILSATNFGTKFIKVLVELPRWLSENKGLIITLVTAMTAYTIAVARNTIATKANELAVKFLTTATGKFFKTLLTNPYVAVGVALSGLTVLIYKLITAKTDAQKAFKEFSTQMATERLEANQLFESLKNTNAGSEERSKLLNTINQKYNDYLPNLLTEKSTLDDINTAQNSVIAGLREKIALQTKDEAINKIVAKSVEDQADYLEKLRNRIAKQKGEDTAGIIIESIQKIYEQNNSDLDLAYKKTVEMLNRQNVYMSGGKKGGNRFFDVGNIALDLSGFNNSMKKMSNGISDVERKFEGFARKVEAPIKGNTTITTTPETITPTADPKTATKNLEIQYKKELLLLQELLRAKIISEQLYYQLSEQANINYLERKISLLKQSGEDSIDAELELSNALTKQQQNDEKKAAEHKKAMEELLKLPGAATAEEDVMLDTTQYSLALRLKILEKFHEKGLRTEAEYLRELAALYKGNQDEINRYLTDESLKQNQQEFDSGIIGRKQYLENVKNITRQYWEEIHADQADLAEKVLEIANVASNVISTIVEAETLAVENKYKKQIDAAKKNGEDTTALEEKMEEEKKKVKKKYADLDFGITVAKIISETALAIMKAAPNLPLQILTGMQGVAQLALANQQRMQVKNLWTGGFTDPGGKYEPRGIVHAGEFVANQEAVRNNDLRRLFNLVDYAQKTNTVARIDRKLIAQTVGATGFATGGFTSGTPAPTIVNNSGNDQEDIITLLNENKSLLMMLYNLLNKGITARTYVAGDGGIEQAQDLYNTINKNTKRS